MLFQRELWKASEGGTKSLRVVFVRSNTGETSGSGLVQCQIDALMVSNPRENSPGGRASRESSGRLAKVENISPRIISVQPNTGETPGSRPLQSPNDDSTKPERELTGGTLFQRELWKAGEGGKDFPKYSFCTIEHWRDPR